MKPRARARARLFDQNKFSRREENAHFAATLCVYSATMRAASTMESPNIGETKARLTFVSLEMTSPLLRGIIMPPGDMQFLLDVKAFNVPARARAAPTAPRVIVARKHSNTFPRSASLRRCAK